MNKVIAGILGAFAIVAIIALFAFSREAFGEGINNSINVTQYEGLSEAFAFAPLVLLFAVVGLVVYAVKRA